MPHIPDKWYAFVLAKTYYNELLDAGVQIYEFIPGFVHAKVFTSDDRKAVVGTINLDYPAFICILSVQPICTKIRRFPKLRKTSRIRSGSVSKWARRITRSSPCLTG